MRCFVSNTSTLKSRPLFLLLALMLVLLAPWSTATADHRHGGSGTCWSSGAAWHYHYTGFDDYEWSVPSDWKTEISQAAATWNAGHDNAANWLFRDSRYNNNIIVRNLGADEGHIAVTNVYASPSTIDRVDTTFNSYYPHKPNAGGTGWYDVQNTMTHEFGHWVMLFDLYSSGCKDATMYGYLAKGETYKQTLTSWDKNGVNWQYP